MKLIVGLGNPGKEFENTRHNVGFMAIDNYCASLNFKTKFDGLYAEKVLDGEKVIFLKPLSYMNLSGIVVKKYVDYFKIDESDMLVIRDDLDIPLGKAKIKYNTSSGGDNGIKSIINELGTQEFTQLKIGISNNKLIDTKDYVLGKFSGEELKALEKVIDLSKDIIDTFILYDKDAAMGKYNGLLK